MARGQHASFGSIRGAKQLLCNSTRDGVTVAEKANRHRKDIFIVSG
jgi:hypothetical protein